MSRSIRYPSAWFLTAALAWTATAVADAPALQTPALQAPGRLPSTVAAPLSVAEKSLTDAEKAPIPPSKAESRTATKESSRPGLQLPQEKYLLPDKAASGAKTAPREETPAGTADGKVLTAEKSAQKSRLSDEKLPLPEKKFAAAPKKRTLNPTLTALRDQVRATLGVYFQQAPNTTEYTTGDILCWCLPFGCETEVSHDREKLNGITCLCWNYPCGGYELLLDLEGHIGARVGNGYQLHAGQLLATLAQSRVAADYPIRVGRTVRSVADLVAAEKHDCRSGIDLSLKLVGIAFYTPAGETWKNAAGESWSVERMLAEMLDNPSIADGCGGVHQLLGMSCAVARQAKSSGTLTGHYARAAKFVGEYQDYALRLQNGNGSWHPSFFTAMGASSDSSASLRSTGHITQWLTVSLPESRLEDPHMQRALAYLCELLGYQQARWDISSLPNRDLDSLTHALSALAVYDQRVFQPCDPPPGAEPAEPKEEQ